MIKFLLLHVGLNNTTIKVHAATYAWLLKKLSENELENTNRIFLCSLLYVRFPPIHIFRLYIFHIQYKYNGVMYIEIILCQCMRMRTYIDAHENVNENFVYI